MESQRRVVTFVEDTKVFRKVKNLGDKQHLQHDLEKCVKWSETLQILINFGKCKCLLTTHQLRCKL